ncbi:hypothetical protein [Streptomyces sp. AGS-58]|uniref:hypothetical protein n=1 Tax=unclassified Streptomyces TaxID=2593676 RepID=UPI0035A2B6EF
MDLIVHAPAGGPGAMGGTAARVLRGLGCPAATAWEVWRPADGGVLALHLAAQYMSGRPGTPLTALVTATDGVAAYADAGREPPGGERADEAAGLVLTTTAGVARLLATAALGEPPHGALLRSDLPWRVPAHRGAPRGRRWPVVRGAGAWRWGRRVGGPAAAGTPALRVPPGHGITPVHGTPPGRGTPPAPTPQLGEREDEAVRLALAQCGRALEDVAYYVLARADGGERPSGGHVAALARLLEGSRTRRGDTVVLVGGDGRGVGCAVLEVARTS